MSQNGQSERVGIWTKPMADVAFIRAAGDTTIIGLRLPNGLTPPLVPSSLVFDNEEQVHLDRVSEDDGGITSFSTEQVPPTDLVGRRVEFRQWWSVESFDAVADKSRSWSYMAAPPPEKHQHCILDWVTISTASEVRSGWYSDDSWICPDCHQRYIVDDHLGICGGA